MYMESRKMVLFNLFAGQQWDRDIEKRFMNTGRGNTEGGTNGESSMETYTLPYVK